MQIHDFIRRYRWTALAVFFAVPSVLSAQIPSQLPSPEQARELLRTRPDLVAQLRARIGASGLTADQIRARLRAAGYPENLLDDYLTGADTTRATQPSGNAIDAVQTLGLVGAEEADSFRFISDSTQRVWDIRRADSLGLDSLVLDSLGVDSLPTDSVARAAMIRRLSTRRPQTGRQRVVKPLTVFGLDVFRRSGTQFQPSSAGPVDENYRLGPGDVLVLLLSGDVEQSHTLTVTRDGFVVLPQVGQLYVANLTLGQLDDLLYTRLGRVYSGVRRGANASTRFKVTVSRLRMNQIFVIGEVVRPGSYQVSGSGTALTALYAAGGPSDNGSLRRVEIRRGGKFVDSLDVYDYLLRGQNSHDIRLETGDVVFVPVHGPQVKVTGRVVRPAIYEVTSGETLRDLLQEAGGFEATALRRRVQINRILPPDAQVPGGPDRSVVDIASDEFHSGFGPAIPMLAGDSVVVFGIADRRRNFVTVNGNVWVQGAVGYTPGMKVSDAVRLAGGPKPDVYLDQILISRLQPDSNRLQLRTAFKDSTGAVTDDIPLQQDDQIQIFSRSSFRPQRYVAITGAVRKPGRLPYREGMTLRDVILQANGLTEDAFLNEAEIARLPKDRSSGDVAVTMRVGMDSTYIFDQGHDDPYLGPPGLPAPASGAPVTVLQAYDNVLILRQPEWEFQRMVSITGQVMYPGKYALRNRTERLAELVERAGGVTRSAYPAGVQFYRSQNRAGRIGVDLPRALKDPHIHDNLMLMGGDSIYIPEYSPVVMVQGAVNSPIAVAYVKGKNSDYYVDAAGGFSRKADKGRTYVAQPSGKVQSVHVRFLLPDTKPNPLPGGVVFVPERDPAEKKDYISLFGTLAQVLGTVLTLAVVITRK
jgi:protein involved in polysaccharide export with SLBB domain